MRGPKWNGCLARAGLAKSGVLSLVIRLLTRIGQFSGLAATLVMMLAVGFASAFVNNTAAVAIFLPIVLGVSRVANLSPTRMLMPLSYASMFGGVCTLIGSSTNILVSSIAASHGQPPFTMFEFAPLGLIMGGSGILYMLLFGIWLIPDRRAGQSLSEVFDIAQYLTDAVLLPEAKSAGKPALASLLAKDLNVQILAVFRDGQPLASPLAELVLAAGDVVRLQCDTKQLAQLPPHRRHSPEHLLHGSFPGQRSSPRAGLPLRLCPPHPPQRSPPLRKVRALLAFTILAAVIAVSALDLAPTFAASSSLLATLLIQCFRSF